MIFSVFYGFANLLHVFMISLFRYFNARALWCSRVLSGASLAHENGRKLTFNRFFVLGKLEIFSLKLRLRLPSAYLLWLIAFICNLLCKFTQAEYDLLTGYIWALKRTTSCAAKVGKCLTKGLNLMVTDAEGADIIKALFWCGWWTWWRWSGWGVVLWGSG